MIRCCLLLLLFIIGVMYYRCNLNTRSKRNTREIKTTERKSLFFLKMRKCTMQQHNNNTQTSSLSSSRKTFGVCYIVVVDVVICTNYTFLLFGGSFIWFMVVVCKRMFLIGGRRNDKTEIYIYIYNNCTIYILVPHKSPEQGLNLSRS